MLVGRFQIMVFPGVAERGKEVDAAPVSLCGGYGIGGFQSAAEDVFRKRIVFQSFRQDFVKLHPVRRNRFGYDQLDDFLIAQPEERAELKHAGVQFRLRLRHQPFCLQGGQLQLYFLAFGDVANATFGFGDFVQFVGIRSILTGNVQVLPRMKQVEEVRHRRKGNDFRLFDVGGLRFTVAERFDAAFPLLVIDAEHGLLQRDANGDAHIFVVGVCA